MQLKIESGFATEMLNPVFHSSVHFDIHKREKNIKDL